ncbi:MAG: CapA family protein [Clostridiales bacterium]|nr:CapA family protein [Roseburia sp.]MDD7635368.1 CapA family protein [Clostridiales bacterium]MDY4111929.1 CapA family protein [Roseburia sp.]
MKKILQNMMYVVSLVIAVGVMVALVRAGGKTAQTQNAVSNAQLPVTEENVTLDGNPAPEKATEAEQLSEEASETEKETTLPIEDAETENAEVIPDEDTTIIFTGDVLFANAFKAGYDAKGIDGVISEELLTELTSADILMVNQEFPFGETGEPVANKQYTFQCSPSYVTALKEMGVDVVSLANNHVLDYGKESLLETFATLDNAGILYGGAGETVERAEEVQVIEVNGRKYGFLAVSRVVPTGDWKVENSVPGVFSCYDDNRLIELVEQASAECDFLAVYPHWGVEHASYPEDYQTKIAERCLAAGADVVVGSHTHCLQGVTFIEDKPVCYSLGNFVFGQNIDRSAILKVTIAADGTVSYRYLPVYATGGVTYLAADEKAEEICTYLNDISVGATVASDGEINKKN